MLAGLEVRDTEPPEVMALHKKGERPRRGEVAK